MNPEDGHDKQESRPDQQRTFEIAGKKVRGWQSMSPDEAEAFLQAILESTPGPVNINTTDKATGAAISAVTDNWNDYRESPQNNADTLAKLRTDLERQGYLALYDQTTGTLDSNNQFITLSYEYFRDFDHFVRRQDIRNLVEQEDAQRIWYDYSCMPQEPMTGSERETFRDSLHYLNSLIAASNFVSIATEDYESRAWCYYEMMIAELLCAGKKCAISRADYSSRVDQLLPQLVLEGMVPELKITKESDRHHVSALLVTGVRLFKAGSIAITLEILNEFGFQFGVGAASRYSEFVSFEQFWRIWQLLASSPKHGGIRFRHLFDPPCLRQILADRYDLLGGHARMYAELPRLMQLPLDLRVVEQGSLNRLQQLIGEILRRGPVKESYTPLAIVMLVYALGTRGAFFEDPKKNDSSERERSAITHLLHAYGLTEDAETEKTLSPDEKIAVTLSGQGYELAEGGKWKEAISYYRKALKHNPQNAVALSNLGNAYQALGSLEEALQYQVRALEVDPENALAWANKAVTLSGLGHREKALECYNRSLQIDPFIKTTWFSQGSLFCMLGRPLEAIKCFEHILEKLDPHMKEAWGAKSEVLKSIGNYERALECLDEFLKIDSEDAQALAEKASVMVTAGQAEGALSFFDKALRLNPDVAKTWYNKGHALQALGRVWE